ncbi:hypothetical protein F4802DRAFT_359123 [Xylaria palmicola]|nr:hypothetical protein F4802DRAFT_359123 [Xylaria palmicola]
MGLSGWKLGSRKQSTASSGNSDTSTSSSTTRTSSPTNKRTSGGGNSRSSKTSSSSSSLLQFPWFRSSSRAQRKSIISPDDPAFSRLHKPFTPQNLEHQKMLSTFEWNFDERDSQRRRTSLSLSPCATRNATADDYAHDDGYGYGPEELPGRHDHMLPPNGQDSLAAPLARLSLREGSSEEPGRRDTE